MRSVKITWFEIPVEDMIRAIKFYEKVFECQLDFQDLGDFKMALFPVEEGSEGASGSLVYHQEFYTPSSNRGVLIYFFTEDCGQELKRVEEAGGKVMIPKRQISPEMGFMGVFLDSEGNRIGIRSKA
ncbi:VOC family protein [Algoriphagus kandeliae]|uniref:VOC family protein n=1 Tax=Algoriphagus kandeliae TaxID=2562278 RepID=A0A4Y9QMZ2_9BACT|nr:VOC family protein [Algoriphagus kandeliae]TFV93218.1 VOC family protein [Algoriphagus kandeliae]